MNEKHVIGKLRELQATFEKELDNVMRFWFKNSHDPSNGYVRERGWRGESIHNQFCKQYQLKESLCLKIRLVSKLIGTYINLVWVKHHINLLLLIFQFLSMDLHHEVQIMQHI